MERLRGFINSNKCATGGIRNSSAALAQLEKHQGATIFKLKREPIPAGLILIQHACTEFMIIPSQPAHWILSTVYFYSSIVTKARLTIIIGRIGWVCSFAAIAILAI